jgi:hypothetical protein
MMKQLVLASAASVSLTALACAEGIPTSGILDTPIGKLEVSNGYPTKVTTKKLFDEMDFQRAVQAYLWALPMVGSAQWQNEQRDKFGAGDLDYVDYLDFKDKLSLLTANATTPYSIAFINLATTGPLVVEIPAGPIAGGILDVWQRPITDTGALGPEKSKGGKFLILGPNDPDMKPDGYYVFRSPTNNIWSGQRGLDPDKAKAGALLEQVRNTLTPSTAARRTSRSTSGPTGGNGRARSRAASPIGRSSRASSTKSQRTSATALR